MFAGTGALRAATPVGLTPDRTYFDDGDREWLRLATRRVPQ